MSVIVEEEPYVAVVRNGFLDSVCSSCFTVKNPRTLQRCSSCNVLHYCSPVCKKKDRKLHKDECYGIKLCNGVPDVLYRTLWRIITRHRRGDSTNVRSFNGRCFNDLMDHYEEISQDKDRMKDVVNAIKLCSLVFTSGPVISEEELIRFYGRIVINQFGISSDGVGIGNGVYLGCCALDHSCSPTAFMRYRGCTAILRSPEPGIVFNDSLKVTYTELLEPSAVRKAYLLKNYYFNCECTACMDTLRDGYTRSIRCKKCSDGVCLEPEKKKRKKKPVLKCEACSAVSDVGFNEVVSAEQEIAAQLDRVDANQDALIDGAADSDLFLKQCLALYKKHGPLFSHLNLKFATLARRIVELSLIGDPESAYAAEYAEKIAPAYKRFLSPGSGDLADALYIAARGAMTIDPPSRKAFEMAQEARDACNLARGPLHPTAVHTKEIVKMYERYFAQYCG